MIIMKLTRILVFFIVAIHLSGCKTEEIILLGDITGVVSDAATSDPIDSVSVSLDQSNDLTYTGNDGKYLLKNLTPGDYKLQGTKLGYNLFTKNVTVSSTKTQNIDFSLNKVPVLKIDVGFLDFGIDSTQLSFTISNKGAGKLRYDLFTSQDWITADPSAGEVTDEIDTITVTINKTDLSDSTWYKETITVNTTGSQSSMPDFLIDVYLNGVMDRDTNYYKVVKIGTQTWMAENLKVGTNLHTSQKQRDNGIIEYYSPNPNYYNIYGGLYQFDEMMQYNPADFGEIGTTQGICPVGWHLPTVVELDVLVNYLGGDTVAGGKLKEKGLAHWDPPNEGATNESGFSALPGGSFNTVGSYFEEERRAGGWWHASDGYFPVWFDSKKVFYNTINTSHHALTVRCVKNP